MLLLSQLATFGTQNMKQHLIKNATLEELLVFKYAFDPYKTYGITSFEIIPDFEGEPNRYMFELLDKLAARELTGNAARNAILEFAQIHGNLIQQICRKKLHCGVQAKTINKVHPKFIPEFNVQLAKELKSEELQKLDFTNMLAQIKYDGVRIITIIDETGKVEFKTRNGKTMVAPSLGNMFSGIHSMVFDGELIKADGAVDKRTSISGEVNSALKGGVLSMEDNTYVIFDCMTLENWQASSCYMTYDLRNSLVEDYVTSIDNKAIHLAVSHVIDDYEDLMSLYEVMIIDGLEGLILKNWNHQYTFKRSKDWIKLKEIRDTELLCIGWEEGKDKYEDMIGALVCTGEVEGKDIQVKVGSGLTDSDRIQDIETYVNQQITIQYNTVIQDSVTGDWSLFLPRFKGVRHDN